MLHFGRKTARVAQRLDAASRERAAREANRPFRDYLARQRNLQIGGYGKDPAKYTGDDATNFIKWNILAAQAELAEVLGETCWKPWATYDVGEVFKDRDKYVEEIVDVMHFIANLLIVAGVTDEELSAAFIEKQRVNAARQQTDGGYKGDGAEWDKEHAPKLG